MENTPALIAFWQAYLDALPAGAPRPEGEVEAWHFCADQPCADELGTLALAGVKTATASLFWAYAVDGEAIPRPGDVSILTDFSGHPLLVLETSAVDIVPFGQVGANQAYAEGEGDRSLAYWREVHWRIFAEAARAIGREPSEEMPVVCEHFRVLWKPEWPSER